MKITKAFFENKDHQEAGKKARDDIYTLLIKQADEQRKTLDFNSVYLSAYLLCKFNNSEYESMTLDDVRNSQLDEDIKNYTIEIFNNETFQNMMQLREKHTSEAFAMTLLLPRIDGKSNMKSESIETNHSINKLVDGILNIKDGEQVADFNTESSDFLVYSALNQKDANYCGYSLNIKNTIITKMRAELLEAESQCILGNVFYAAAEKYDKIFSFIPFAIKMQKERKEDIIKMLSQENHYPKRGNPSVEWMMNMLIHNKLNDTGKAVSLVPCGILYRAPESNIRRYFVENQLIESIIFLPCQILEDFGGNTALVVISRNNEKIKMIDASKIYHQVNPRRQNVLTDEDADKIIDLYNLENVEEDVQLRKDVHIQEISSKNYQLDVVDYFKKDFHFKNAVPFKSVIKKITRGMQTHAVNIKALKSEMPTNMQYLQISDINNGIINDDLQYLKEAESIDEKYCVKNNGLIISKNAPFKAAVAEVKNSKILASLNLYIIEIDQKKANPYYLSALFNSTVGNILLSQAVRTSTIPIINMSDLKEIVIPLPPMERQNEIAEHFQIITDKIKIYRMHLQKENEHLSHLIDEESDGLYE